MAPLTLGVVLETLLMALIRLTGGRLAEVFFGIEYEGSVRRCTSFHVFASWGGEPMADKGPPHLDVRMRFWSRGGHASTVLSLGAERLPDMKFVGITQPGSYVLEPSGAPLDIEFQLWPIPDGAPIPCAAGDVIPFGLRMSRGWTKKIALRVDG